MLTKLKCETVLQLLSVSPAPKSKVGEYCEKVWTLGMRMI
jgi:hypothetical protein